MCGIFGISTNDFSYSIAGKIYPGLMALQHRGQLFAGIATHSEGRIYSYKNRGISSRVLNPKRLKTFSGNVGIGHVYYGSSDQINIEHAQPYHFRAEHIEFAVAFDGVITNYDEIYQRLQNMGRVFSSTSDIELIATLIETYSKFSETMLDTLRMVIKTLKGAFSLVLLNRDGNLYAMRDPNGYKPLCYGKLKLGQNKKFNLISSESCSFDILDGKLIDDVKPGEIIQINPITGLKTYREIHREQKRICHFEYTYFARPDSIIDGVSVAQVRYDLGRNLAKNDDINLKGAIVVPVPDSGRSIAMGYSWGSGLVYQEGLMKNRYMWHIKSKAKEKLSAIKPLVQGKDIILLDDSIVSGNTLKTLIDMLREAGAHSIHARIGNPPIIKNCAINKSLNRNKLIAYSKKIENYCDFDEEMRKYIDADSLKYQTIEGLVSAIGLNGKGKDRICLGCLMEYCLIDEERYTLAELTI